MDPVTGLLLGAALAEAIAGTKVGGKHVLSKRGERQALKAAMEAAVHWTNRQLTPAEVAFLSQVDEPPLSPICATMWMAPS